MATPRGSATQGAARLVIAASQGWRCSECRELLSSAFQVDHTVALADGGADDVTNATALCANCHALKTQREHIARTRKREVTVAEAYADREDRHTVGVATCQRCRQTRPSGTPHPVCWAIEPPAAAARVKAALARFAWAPSATRS
jgi:hypothetical protein